MKKDLLFVFMLVFLFLSCSSTKKSNMTCVGMSKVDKVSYMSDSSKMGVQKSHNRQTKKAKKAKKSANKKNSIYWYGEWLVF